MTGNSVALDTNQAVAILNDDPTSLHFYSAFSELAIPTPVLGELIYGALNSNKVAENLAAVDRLASRCRLLEIRKTTCTYYAQVRLALKQAGRPIPSNDVWIGAICVEHQIRLATADQHFTSIKALDLVTPP